MGLRDHLKLSDDYYTRRRQLITRSVIIVVLVLAILGLIFILLRKQSEPPRQLLTSSHIVIPALGSNQAAISENAVTLFNGRNFVDYNLAEGTTQQILSDSTFPSVIKVSWSPNGQFASFYSSQQTSRDVLGKILVQQGKSLDSSYWWVFDKQTKSFDLIDDGRSIRDISWSTNNELFALGFGGTSEGDVNRKPNTPITVYSLSEKQFKPFAEIKDDFVDRIFPTEQGLFYTSVSGRTVELKQLVDGADPKVVANTNNDKVGVSADGNYLFYFTLIGSSSDEPQGADIQDESDVLMGTVTVVETASNKKILDLPNLSADGHFTFSEANIFWALTTNSEAQLNLTSYNLASGMAEQYYRIENSSTSLLDVLSIDAIKNTVFVQSLRGFDVVGNSQVKNSNMPIKLGIKKSGSAYQPYVMTQSQRDFKLIATIFAPPADKYKAEVLDEIRALGGDPNLFIVEYDTTNLEDPT